jgi:Tfp pilus assembly protein PilO
MRICSLLCLLILSIGIAGSPYAQTHGPINFADELEWAKKEVSQISAIRKYETKLRSDLEEHEKVTQDLVNSFFPERPDTADFLSRLQNLADRGRLKLEAAQPEVIDRDSYQEIVISLTITGSMVEIALFVDRVQRFSRISVWSETDRSEQGARFKVSLYSMMPIGDIVLRSCRLPEPGDPEAHRALGDNLAELESLCRTIELAKDQRLLLKRLKASIDRLQVVQELVADTKSRKIEFHP